MTHLNDISKVYLEQVSESAVPGKPAERLGAVTAIPKSEQEAARERILAKTAAKRAKMKEELDPVGQEDADIDNDGDTDKTDKYLHKRRKAIGKAIAKKKGMKESSDYDPMEDPDFDHDEAEENRGVSGKNNPKGGKALGKKKKSVKESFSNWRKDLSEVVGDVDNDVQIKEKKVNNKVKINPSLGEAVEEMGGILIEMVEIDEFDFIVEGVYVELLEEGYSEDQIEYGIETALTLDEGYYDSAVSASKAKAKEAPAPKKSIKDRLKSAAKKAIVGSARAAGKAVRTGAAVAAAPGRVKGKASSIADRVKKAAEAGYAAGRGPVEPKSTYRGAGVGRKEKIGEETGVESVEQIDEKTLTKKEMSKREEIVKSMKDKKDEFEKRYPGRGEEVMYATATKMAKKMVESISDQVPLSPQELQKQKQRAILDTQIAQLRKRTISKTKTSNKEV